MRSSPGWPGEVSSSAELLAPFLTCASPAEFLALQREVEMPKLVEAMDDWRAVRLGAMGPVDAESSSILSRKRAAFIVAATDLYGTPWRRCSSSSSFTPLLMMKSARSSKCAGRDALATIPILAESAYTDFDAKRSQLPPPYRQVLHDHLGRSIRTRRAVLLRWMPGHSGPALGEKR